MRRTVAEFTATDKGTAKIFRERENIHTRAILKRWPVSQTACVDTTSQALI
jgi:hypothetical protein